MGALVGFIIGFVVGGKAGPEGLEELRKAWQAITSSEEFQGLAEIATAYARNLVAQGGENLASQLQTLAKGNEHIVAALGGSPEGLGDAWARLSRSPEFQVLLASGTALIGNMLAQRAAAGSGSSFQGH